MSIHFLSAENIRKPLRGILDSIIEQHIAHRLVDDFLILTPDETCAQDLRSLLLKDSRLHGVLSGESILSLETWIAKTCDALFPRTRLAPAAILEALFRHILHQDADFQSSRFSVESLYLLISSFREAFLNASALRNFLESFDPELARNCVHWFSEYQKKIDETDYLKDFHWQAQQAFKSFGSQNSLAGVGRIYYLGFLNFPPLLKLFCQHLEKSRPEISQLVLFQKPQDIDVQDHLSKHWESALPSLYPFQEKNPSPPLQNFKTYASPFDEAGQSLRDILACVKAGTPASSIGLFLPPHPFYFDYYSKELEKLGIGQSSHKGKKLASFAILQNLLLLPLSEALLECGNLLKNKLAEWEEITSGPKAEPAEEIRALHAFQEILEELEFYRSEMPELEAHFPALPALVQQNFLKDRQIGHAGVQIRSLFRPGLREFEKSFFIQMTDAHFPLSEERFFNLSLPQFDRQNAQQKALLQHLWGSAAEMSVSYSRFSFQASEQSPSSFLSSFAWEENSSAKPFSFLKQQSPELERKLQIEILRREDLHYRNPYGGWIQDRLLLEKFREHLKKQIFSPSRLEDYATCPFSFFARTLLGLVPEEEKTIEANPLEQGRWLHEALEAFFKDNISILEEAGEKPAQRGKIRLQLAEVMRQAGESFLKDKDWVNPRLFQDFTARATSSSQALLDSYWQQWDTKQEPILSPRFFEMDFGFRTPALEFHRPPLPPLKIRGKIDRIDVSQDGKMMIYDYKTGETGGLSAEIQNFKKLQLPLYLMAAKKSKSLENYEEMGALALGLKDMSQNQGLIQGQFAKALGIRANSKSVLNEEQWQEFWKQIEETLLDYQARMFEGDFRTQPEPCQEFCQYQTICRYHERKKA